MFGTLISFENIRFRNTLKAFKDLTALFLFEIARY